MKKDEVNAWADDDVNEAIRSEGKSSGSLSDSMKELIFHVFLWNLPLTVNVSENEKKKIDKKIGLSDESIEGLFLDNILGKLRTVISWRATLIMAHGYHTTLPCRDFPQCRQICSNI